MTTTLTVRLAPVEARTIVATVAAKIAGDGEQLGRLFPPDRPEQITAVAEHAARTARLSGVLEQIRLPGGAAASFTANGRTVLEILAALESDAEDARTHPGELPDLPYSDTARTIAGSIA